MWYLLVTLITLQFPGNQEGITPFVFEQPVFSSLEECQSFVYFQNQVITAYLQYEVPEAIGYRSMYCVPEEGLKELIEKGVIEPDDGQLESDPKKYI